MASNQPLDIGKWRSLFEWSMKYQHGAGPGGAAAPLDPDKKAWLDNALQDLMKDFAERMKEINTTLSSPEQEAEKGAAGDATGDAAGDTASGASLAEKEALCDELMEIVENLDYARDLHKIGGLPTLLSLMSSRHPSLRWRAAEIAATCMANNPPVQRWFMAGGALAPLMLLLSDPHPVVATKGLLGLSALVRHYDQGLEAFRLAGGLNKLLALLGCHTDSTVPAAAAAAHHSSQEAVDAAADPQQRQQQRRRLLRKDLALLQYVLAKHPADAFAAAEFGAVPCLQGLLSDSDSDMRTASLAVLSEVVSSLKGWQWVKQHDAGLLGTLQGMQQQQQQQQGAGGSGGAAEQHGEEGQSDEEEELLQRLVQLLQAAEPPSGSGVGLQDHVEVDPYQDGRQRKEPQTLHLRPPEQHRSGGGLAITPAPKQDLR